MILLPEPKSITMLKGVCSNQEHAPLIQHDSVLSEEDYRLSISPKGISITYGSDAGLQYAHETLAQIRMQCGDALPCLEIDDAPALAERCFMLDVSRCKVPTLDSLKHIADILASLKMNQFQLYMEHTFAYKDHETVWCDSSPLTGEDIRELDSYCCALHIELIPNQNSFGHMERWLRHDRYRHLAECPDGFVHPVDGVRRQFGSTLKPNDASLDFVCSLFDELLPNFTSRKFNVGCDEAWELGTGWSKPLADKQGKGQLYIDHLSKIVALANAQGHEALYWADGLLNHPDLLPKAPANACPVIWGYEADHPFEEQCAQISDAGLPFYVAPGDSTWNSFTGRLHIARVNIPVAASVANRYGARGLIHTHWGDNGHPQTWAVALPGLVLAANAAWNPEAIEVPLADALDMFVFKDKDRYTGKAVVALGELDEALGINILNRSFLFEAFRLPPDKLLQYLDTLSDEKIQSVQLCMDEIQDYLGKAQPTTPDASIFVVELQLACAMSYYALQRAKHIRDKASLSPLQGSLAELKARYSKIWLKRNRPGGLDESLSLFVEKL